MNLLNYFKENIHMDKINNIDDNMKEMAIVRYVLLEASKLFYRDYTFFLNKENINGRGQIYDKKQDLQDIQDFAIVCKSYCQIIKEILEENYNINSELISAASDRFKHVDLLVTTKNGERYIIDPLMDLVRMQVGLRTSNFASEEYFNEMYVGKVDDISFLDKEQLEKIDNEIGYKNGGVYLDDFLTIIRQKLDNIEKLLSENEKVAKSLLGKEYDGHEIMPDERTELKLKFISKYMNNRKNVHGFVDLVILSNIVIEELFTKEEQKRIKQKSFFVDEKDIKDEEFKKLFKKRDSRKRGQVVSFNGKNYIFTLGQKTKEYSDEEWKKIVQENGVFIKPKYPSKLLKYLKMNGADRNIVHNSEFLRLLNKFEMYLENSGKTIEEIKKDNLLIFQDMIFTKFDKKNIAYKIEDGNLIIKDYTQNIKYIVNYNDEGRDISYITNPILKENEILNEYEFDSNGMFELEEVSGIEDLVAPLSNGKYLSKNGSYYRPSTYTELFEQRRKLREVLTDDVSKKNFVILEYMSNASAKIYFEELKKKIENKENCAEEAKRCLEEDCDNIVRFFKKEPIIKPVFDLPKGQDRVLERYIEMDNKQILNMFCSTLKFSKEKHVMIPGLGSILVGPMLKSMYGFDYTNIMFSLYSKDEKLRDLSSTKSFEETCSNSTWKTTENELVLIDDNVASCSTMNTIREKLKEYEKKCRYGAIKYNWKFFKEVKHGELDHTVFDTNKVDFLTVIDDPGYWVMRDSIKALKENGGDAYIDVMIKEGLRREDKIDLEILAARAELYSQMGGVNLHDGESGKIKKTSVYMCNTLRERINQIAKESRTKGRGKDE